MFGISLSCDLTLSEAKSNKHICNPYSGNWVEKTSKIGSELVNIKEETLKTKEYMIYNLCNPNSKHAKDDKYICDPSQNGV